jgi:uncharacterized membrane protein
MNLVNILYEPYVIIIFLSLIITVIAYFILKKNENPDNPDKNNSIILLYTFIITLVILILSKFGITYMNNNNFLQKGGVDISERLTIVADDIDFNLIEE